jgi:hypothetical protein
MTQYSMLAVRTALLHVDVDVSPDVCEDGILETLPAREDVAESWSYSPFCHPMMLVKLLAKVSEMPFWIVFDEAVRSIS